MNYCPLKSQTHPIAKSTLKLQMKIKSSFISFNAAVHFIETIYIIIIFQKHTTVVCITIPGATGVSRSFHGPYSETTLLIMGCDLATYQQPAEQPNLLSHTLRACLSFQDSNQYFSSFISNTSYGTQNSSCFWRQVHQHSKSRPDLIIHCCLCLVNTVVSISHSKLHK